MLDVSQQFVIQQMENKEIPFLESGKHRRIKIQDLQNYKRKIDTSREMILDELAAEAQKLNMGY